jgi:hypothetical protein
MGLLGILGDKVHWDIEGIVVQLAQLAQPVILDIPAYMDQLDILDQLEKLVRLV